MKILCVLNPIAGGGRITEQVTFALHRMLKHADITYEIVHTQKKGDGHVVAKDAVSKDYTHVVAVGGDGTINEVASGVVNSSAIFCIIPCGSGNGLARALGISLNYQEACQLILQGKSRKIDVGQVEGRYFFATSGIGYDAHVGKQYNEKSHSRGILPYFQVAASEYFNYIPQKVSLYCNGETFHYTPFVLTIANVEQYGGGAIIAPGAQPDDGLFDISVLPHSHFLHVLRHAPKLFTGSIHNIPDFVSHKTASLTITRTTPGPVHVDGEIFHAGQTLEYVLLPHVLNIQVPAIPARPKYIPQANTTLAEGNTLHTLEKLNKLKERGIITEEEFNTQKQKLLDRL